MHSLATWVKNVYSLCVQGMENRGHLSTLRLQTSTHYQPASAQPTRFTQSIRNFPPTVYTPKNDQITPSNSHLYTLSTPPTIKKNKKK